MTRRCANPSCFADDGEQCAEGNPRLDDCAHWTRADEAASEDARPAVESSQGMRVSWSGAALGPVDLASLTPRTRPVLVGVIGPHDAGKTTLLVGTYLMIQRGHALADAAFAGSRTLGAWESLAAWARFDDACPPTFPPHTARGTDRAPGLLHIALRRGDDLRDVLLADAPGEWFSRWATKEDAPDAEGAVWVARRAHGFVLVADCARLAGPNRGGARRELRSIIERLGNHVGRRPVLLVWAKADHAPPDGIRRAIRRALESAAPHAMEVESTTDRPETLIDAIGRLVTDCWHPPPAEPVMPPVLEHTPFGAFRGHR